MHVNIEKYTDLQHTLQEKGATLVAVSKLKPASAIRTLYDLGHRDFGENYVQELVDKKGELPGDIKWHFIGHLQTNKVRYIAPFVSLIHGVDSFKLLKEIDKEGRRAGRVIDVLLQVRIASEETKFGLQEIGLHNIFEAIKVAPLTNVAIRGFMGMASFSEDRGQVEREFAYLNTLFSGFKSKHPSASFNILSMGMSDDFDLALHQGSNMIRIGSRIFGSRS